MKPCKAKEQEVLSVFCPYLNKTVILKRETWYYKIIKEHPEVGNCINLIKQILSKPHPSIYVYKKIRDRRRIAVFKECPHLKPLNNYVKIGLRIKNGEAVITTCHGQFDLPKLGMERMFI